MCKHSLKSESSKLPESTQQQATGNVSKCLPACLHACWLGADIHLWSDMIKKQSTHSNGGLISSLAMIMIPSCIRHQWPHESGRQQQLAHGCQAAAAPSFDLR
jgi:hypothetical protein